MSAISAENIISIIQSEIENFEWKESDRETGKVIWVGDGIATIYGIEHASYCGMCGTKQCTEYSSLRTCRICSGGTVQRSHLSAWYMD